MNNIATSLQFVLLIAFCAFLTSCATEEITVTETDPVFPDQGEIINTTLTGRVANVSGQPVEGALVTCLSCNPSQSMVTDAYGNYAFNKVSHKGELSLLAVTSTGNFDNYRRHSVQKDLASYSSIIVREKALLGTVNTNQAETLTHQSGATISLPENAIRDEAGNNYNGDYQVYLSWIDPSAANLNETMMGDLSAIDAEGEQVGLSTFGMLQVELEAEDGSPLNLQENQTAELSFPVPSGLLDRAPESIPLWSYDEENGYWLEEGEALLTGSNYVGLVSHFSTWNVDSKVEDAIDICGSITLSTRGDEFPLSYYEVTISGNSFNGVGGWLSENGTFHFINLPPNQNITLSVKDYCGNEVYSTVVEAGTDNIKLDPIVLRDTAGVNYLAFSGNALDCNGLPVGEGYVSIDIGATRQYNIPLGPEGQFEIVLPVCNQFELTLRVINLADFGISNDIVITEFNQDLDLTDILVCSDFQEYFYINFGDMNENILLDEQLMWYENISGIHNFAFTDNGLAMISLSEEPILNEVVLGTPEDRLTIINIPFTFTRMEFIFTEIGPINSEGNFEVIEGSFNLIGNQFWEETVSGSFRLKAR